MTTATRKRPAAAPAAPPPAPEAGPLSIVCPYCRQPITYTLPALKTSKPAPAEIKIKCPACASICKLRLVVLKFSESTATRKARGRAVTRRLIPRAEAAERAEDYRTASTLWTDAAKYAEGAAQRRDFEHRATLARMYLAVQAAERASKAGPSAAVLVVHNLEHAVREATAAGRPELSASYQSRLPQARRTAREYYEQLSAVAAEAGDLKEASDHMSHAVSLAEDAEQRRRCSGLLDEIEAKINPPEEPAT